MSPYLTNTQLNLISNLFIAKQKQLLQLSGNLQIQDVKEDTGFDATVKRIKSQILLTPVVFNEPAIRGHKQTTRQVPPNYQNMWGGPQDVFIVTVDFVFTGSKELFEFMPEGVAMAMGRLYQPSGNKVTIDVTIANLDKVAAIGEANNVMSATFDLIKANNIKATEWSTNKEADIDTLLIQRRKEVIDFYS